MIYSAVESLEPFLQPGAHVLDIGELLSSKLRSMLTAPFLFLTLCRCFPLDPFSLVSHGVDRFWFRIPPLNLPPTRLPSFWPLWLRSRNRPLTLSRLSRSPKPLSRPFFFPLHILLNPQYSLGRQTRRTSFFPSPRFHRVRRNSRWCCFLRVPRETRRTTQGRRKDVCTSWTRLGRTVDLGRR